MNSILQSYPYPDPIAISLLNGMQNTDHNNNFQEITCDGKTHYSCTFSRCGKIFRYKSEFMRHSLTHTFQRPVNCPFDTCNKTFKSEEALKNHMRIHSGETPYKCQEPDCGQSFSSRPALKYHNLKHKGAKEYRCSFPGCNKMFLNISQLKQHENTLNYHQKMSYQAQFKEADEYDKIAVKVRKLENTPESELIASVKDEKISKGLDWEGEIKRMLLNLFNENNTMKIKLGIHNTPKELVHEIKI